MELKEDRKIYVFEHREINWEKTIIISSLFHFILFSLLIFSFKIFPENFFRVTGKGGTIQIGETISAGLVAKVKGKSNFYKPPLRKLKKKGYKIKESKRAISKKTFVEKKKNIKKNKDRVSDTEGTLSGNSKIDEGIKKGEIEGVTSSKKIGGLSLGSGGGNESGGIYSSWYAREVEAKISRNWLTSQMGVVYNRICKVVISFEITPEGKIVNVKVKEKNAPPSFVRSALRAVYASNPLPQLPFQYKIKGENVKFMAIFEYPPR